MEQSKFYQIKNVTEHEYNLVGCDGSVITRPIRDIDKSASVFTIQDAKDGDILQSNNKPFIYNEYLEEGKYPFGYGGINLYGRFGVSNGLLPMTHDEVTPATKEQRDLLFQKMKEAGYEWDAEKKELRLLITNGGDFFESENCEQKPAEEYSFNIESEFFHQLTKEQQELWKKEIEQAYNAGVEASDEWSEEDETKMHTALAFIKSEFPKEGNEEIMEDTIEWFKSLKQRIG